MRRHISPIAKQRISDFFIQEDGNVGRKNALIAGTVLSSVMLAATLFGPETANAAASCPDWYYICGTTNDYTCCSFDEKCCLEWVGGEVEFFCSHGCPDD